MPPSSLSSFRSNLVLKCLDPLSSSRYDGMFAALLCTMEAVLCYIIITKVPYTEIDWKAYMQEVEGWLVDGNYDYRQLRGDTGPLVYPAGFLYLFAIFRWLTESGTNILKAQYIFAGLYVLQLAVVLSIYTHVMRSARQSTNCWKFVWSWRLAMGCLCLSKRVHSLFVLRLFNDGAAMLLFYLSVYCMVVCNRWHFGCFLFSLAVSVKMNILLFAPGLLLLLLQTHSSWKGTFVGLSICALTQLVLGAPFLARYPESYLRKAFELDRTFFYKWTVNWKFLPERIFLSKSLSMLLLLLHLATLLYLAFHWLKPDTATSTQTRRYFWFGQPLRADYCCYTLFLSNFVGIVFCRSIHYQFYAWYFHSLPLLLWTVSLPKYGDNTIVSYLWVLLRNLGLLVVIEYAFLTFPATPISSLLLQLAHYWILFLCIKTTTPSKGSFVMIDDVGSKISKKE
mmetsp:Transcript_18443/g.27329  ORF Transcript_18443/g.27329 Transcript_18443/m.27329 type:complete len:452 (+) Transcript_18443:277-1632(+)